MNPDQSSSAATPDRSEANRRHAVASCFVCGAARLHYLYSVGDRRLMRCTDCNFILLNPQPSDDELAAASPKPTTSETASEAGAGQSGKPEEVLEALVAYSGFPIQKILVVADGDTGWPAAAARRGFAVTTLAPSRTGSERLGQHEGGFDACVVAEVFESLREPREFLRNVHHALRPGGALLVSSPLLTRARRMEFAPRRLTYFTRKSLESLVFAQGFRALTWSSGDESAILLGRRADRRERPLLSIIVPVFNEAATFRSAFSRLLAHPFPGCDVEFLLVESNSTDGTRALVNEYAAHPRVRVLLEDRPRGKGHAVRTGLRACAGDFIAIQDADLEYDVDDYDALLEPLFAHREAFVLGARHGGRSRKMRQFEGQPLTSGLLNFGHLFFTALLNVCLGTRLKDPFTMYKLFRRDCIHDLEFEANRFDFDWELVIKLIRKGYVPIEIPVNYRSRSFHEGKKVRVIRDPLSWFVALAKFRFQRLGPRTPAAKPTLSADTPVSPR